MNISESVSFLFYLLAELKTHMSFPDHLFVVRPRVFLTLRTTEPISKNLTQNIFCLGKGKFVQMKGHALFLLQNS